MTITREGWTVFQICGFTIPFPCDEPKPQPDPLVKAAKAAYRKSTTYQVEKLFAEESRWKRKQTIASNKLKSVRNKIQQLALGLAKEKDGGKYVQPGKEG